MAPWNPPTLLRFTGFRTSKQLPTESLDCPGEIIQSCGFQLVEVQCSCLLLHILSGEKINGESTLHLEQPWRSKASPVISVAWFDQNTERGHQLTSWLGWLFFQGYYLAKWLCALVIWETKMDLSLLNPNTKACPLATLNYSQQLWQLFSTEICVPATRLTFPRQQIFQVQHSPSMSYRTIVPWVVECIPQKTVFLVKWVWQGFL